MLELGLKTLCSYLLGSINGSILLGRLRGIDVRTFGSGNPGATNALRAQGKWFALGVAIIDVAKGFIPAAYFPAAALMGIARDPAVDIGWLTVACAGAAVVGHCYPVWHRFAGGKGAATAVGALAAIHVALLLPLIAVWIGVLVVTGYVGAATMGAFAVLPFYYFLSVSPIQIPLLTLLSLLAIFIVFTHRSNVQRLMSGQEHRMDRAQFWKRP